MTWGEIIGIVLILTAAVFIWLAIKNIRAHRAIQDKIYQDEIEKTVDKLTQDITPSLLSQYGFQIHDTKDQLYAIKGSISMTDKGDYWETEIQAPGRVLWRDTHDQLSSLLVFCEKHGYELTKEEEG